MTNWAERLGASINVLADKVGMTHKELSRKATDIQAAEKATETRLMADEESTKKQFGEVSGEVTGVKGEVTKVSADVSDTRNDLATTKGKLDHAIGDLTKHGELIATTHDELEYLKHRGDRDYFEFTLRKGKDPTHLSIISLQLKKLTPRETSSLSTFWRKTKRLKRKTAPSMSPCSSTLDASGAFEVVVNTVDKETVTGYLSTPKNAATTQMPSHGATQQ